MSAMNNFQLSTYAEQMREQRDDARCALAEAQELIAALEARNAELERLLGLEARQERRAEQRLDDMADARAEALMAEVAWGDE